MSPADLVPDTAVVVLVLLVLGVNASLWGALGVLRWCDERLQRPRPASAGPDGPDLADGPDLPLQRVRVGQVAVLMAAHDEELVIEHSLRALEALLPAGDVHVVSDWSTDRTAELARARGANVLETTTNVGKAEALALGIREFELASRYEAVLVLDADTQLDPRYLEEALPLLDDPRVAAVAGCAQTRWHPAELGWWGAALVAHRQRIYVLTQRLLKYGQTWRGLSATHIVPGFASIYRSRALERIDVSARGLVIEDFNMTFALHTQRLGRIAFTPAARAYTQDPSTFRDYVRQTQRWSLGLWQTVRRHRPRSGVFAAALWLVLAELVTSSLLFVLLPVGLVVLGGTGLLALLGWPPAVQLTAAVDVPLALSWVVVGVLLPDYVLSCAVALAERRPQYLWLGPAFWLLRVVDAAVALQALPRAFTTRSTGSWTSPTRRAVITLPETELFSVDTSRGVDAAAGADPAAPPARDRSTAEEAR
ncbi:glycosyltransferase family 2 protein [Quadrisphaera setariae]|uniref:glycosyltransferase family 2 protein n=1 Tax=Quadrisphaera setariae TaxID=2593304 RepID=UPI001C9C5C3B|nr:glycosyltransferase family 2 protein [Quadrisphaera setariae]